MEMKRCSRCDTDKSLEEFYDRPRKLKTQEKLFKSSQCKECERARKNPYMQKYRVENREDIRRRDVVWRKKHPRRVRDMNLKKLYGTGIVKFEQMLLQQNNKCWICGHEHKEGHQSTILHTDHDHKTKVIRGLLCKSCNIGLGNFKDSVEFLIKAIDYLMKTK